LPKKYFNKNQLTPLFKKRFLRKNKKETNVFSTKSIMTFANNQDYKTISLTNLSYLARLKNEPNSNNARKTIFCLFIDFSIFLFFVSSFFLRHVSRFMGRKR
jgi:hypothetical protein